jgi:hypothetical protein
MNNVNVNAFEEVDLGTLDHVVGGGRLWRKIKRGVRNWATQIGQAIEFDAKEKTEKGGLAGEGDGLEAEGGDE